MKHAHRRAAAAGISALLSFAMLSSSATAFAEIDLTGLTDLNYDGVIDVFDYVLAKRGTVEETAPLELTIESVEAAAGSVANVTVSVTQNPGCLGMYLIIDYAPELIPYIPEGAYDSAVTDPDNFSIQRPQLTVLEDAGTVLYSSGRFKMCYDNGTLFNISFLVPEDALPGTTYTLSLRRHDIYDENYEMLSMLTARGKVTVSVPEDPTEIPPDEPGEDLSKNVTPVEPGEEPAEEPVEDPTEEPIVTEPAEPVTEPEPVVTTPYVRTGIDVSVWQGSIDFTKLPENISFVMLRAGYGRYASQEDKRFAENYTKAKAAGVPVGAYWYSYAMSPEEARIEARACMQVLGDRSFEYPIAFDVEESKQLALGVTQVSAIVCAFCEEMEAAGYYVSLYMSSYYLNHTINQTVKDRYDVWVANYNVAKPSYTGSYGMWQYSATGSVTGISGAVDMDYCYRNYPAIMTRAGLNGY